MVTPGVDADLEALRQDISKLRADVAALVEAFVASGKEKADAVRLKTATSARHRLQEIGESLDAVKQRGHDALERAERRVAQHPLASIAGMFALGFLTGRLFGRGD
jgi:ElaB/YqjD/DUF883 family membrane-anchored ribosome-binding protein